MSSFGGVVEVELCVDVGKTSFVVFSVVVGKVMNEEQLPNLFITSGRKARQTSSFSSLAKYSQPWCSSKCYLLVHVNIRISSTSARVSSSRSSPGTMTPASPSPSQHFLPSMSEEKS